MPRRSVVIAAIVVFAAAAAWILFIGLPLWYSARRAPAAAVADTPATATAVRKITATLYFISNDGMALVGVQREIPFAPTVVEQARAIIEAQLTAAPPLVSAIPAATTLRDVFFTERGDAFVDLSGEVVTRHPGGSLDEVFTVYALVNALTVNLPAVTRVQILVDGKELDTLAGHVDLRHPLAKSLEWVVHESH